MPRKYWGYENGAVKVVEAGGRRYAVRPVKADRFGPGGFVVHFTALRGGEPYGPAFGMIRPKGNYEATTFTTVEAAEAAIAKHAEKPYKPSGKYAERAGIAGKVEGD